MTAVASTDHCPHSDADRPSECEHIVFFGVGEAYHGLSHLLVSNGELASDLKRPYLLLTNILNQSKFISALTLSCRSHSKTRCGPSQAQTTHGFLNGIEM